MSYFAILNKEIKGKKLFCLIKDNKTEKKYYCYTQYKSHDEVLAIIENAFSLNISRDKSLINTGSKYVMWQKNNCYILDKKQALALANIANEKPFETEELEKDKDSFTIIMLSKRKLIILSMILILSSIAMLGITYVEY